MLVSGRRHDAGTRSSAEVAPGMGLLGVLSRLAGDRNRRGCRLTLPVGHAISVRHLSPALTIDPVLATIRLWPETCRGDPVLFSGLQGQHARVWDRVTRVGVRMGLLFVRFRVDRRRLRLVRWKGAGVDGRGKCRRRLLGASLVACRYWWTGAHVTFSVGGADHQRRELESLLGCAGPGPTPGVGRAAAGRFHALYLQLNRTVVVTPRSTSSRDDAVFDRVAVVLLFLFLLFLFLFGSPEKSGFRFFSTQRRRLALQHQQKRASCYATLQHRGYITLQSGADSFN